MPEQIAERVVVDRDVCMGSGMCIVYAPATFSQDEETKAVAGRLGVDDLAAVRTAVDACPTGALAFVTDQRGV